MEAARIRPATAADLDALESLENRAFETDRLSRRSLRYYTTASTAVLLVVEADGQLAGDGLVAFRRNAAVARLYSIVIDPAFVGRGLGRMLLAACEDAARGRSAKTLRLEVRDSNHAAIALYERSGFQKFGTYPDYYEDGATALRFEKSIAPVSGIGVSPAKERTTP